MTRAVVIKTMGDPEIGEAIARGMLAAMDAKEREDLGRNQIEVVEAEIDRQRIQADLLKVAAGNLKSAEDYELLLVKARAEIDALNAEPGPMRRLGRWLLGLYGLAVVGVARAYRAQDLVLGGGRDA